MDVRPHFSFEKGDHRQIALPVGIVVLYVFGNFLVLLFSLVANSVVTSGPLIDKAIILVIISFGKQLAHRLDEDHKEDIQLMDHLLHNNRLTLIQLEIAVKGTSFWHFSVVQFTATKFSTDSSSSTAPCPTGGHIIGQEYVSFWW